MSDTFKFTANTAADAAAAIRERLGPEARVLAVRTVPAPGLRRLWSSPRIEVTAQMAAETAEEMVDDSADSEVERVAPDALERPLSVPSASSAARSTFDLPAPSLHNLLRRAGLSEVAMARLHASANWAELTAAPLHLALVEIGRRLRQDLASRPNRGPLRRVAFIGTSGSGRTTALCKWIGAEVYRRGRRGRVVAVEFDRPNALGPLPLYGEALGVAVDRYPAPTQPETPGGFVAFDLPSLSLSQPAANAPLQEFLDREGIRDRVLVINAAYDHGVLRSTYTAGRALGATHLVFTHLDEAGPWGRLWDYLFDRALEPLFLATGPSLCGEVEEDVIDALVRRTLAAGAEANPLSIAEPVDRIEGQR